MVRGKARPARAGFFSDLIVPLDGVRTDHFPRRDTSLVKLGNLKPVFDRTGGKGTLTAGNSSPLTDGAAAIWVAAANGISRLPQTQTRQLRKDEPHPMGSLVSISQLLNDLAVDLSLG